MLEDRKSLEESDVFHRNRMSRRRLLQLLGYGTAGVVGMDVLAGCSGLFPQPSVSNTATVTSSTTVTSTLEVARPLTPYFLGFNDEAIHSLSWNNTDFAKAAAQLKPGTLRYPGGTIANYWDWKKGWFLPNVRSGFLTIKPVIYRLQELQKAVQATGAIPIYVLNMLTSDLNYQLEMLRAAKGMGLPVQLVEMGNEFYLDQSDNVAKFATGQDYGKVTTDWISAIRAEFPDVKIAAVGGLPEAGASNDHGRRKKWTKDVLQTLQGADALTLHMYVDIQEKLVSRNVPSTGPEAVAAAEKIADALTPKWQEAQATFNVMPSNLGVWFTEFNLTDRVGNIHFRWIQGIFVASMVLTFLEENRSTLACLYDLICGHGGFEALACSDTSQGYQGESTPLAPFSPTAIGWVTKLLSDTMQGMTSARQISFNPNPLIAGDNSPDTSASSSLMGWGFTDGTRQHAFILNRSAHAFLWKPDTALPQEAQYQQLSSDPLKLITGADALTMKSGKLQGQLLLPAYSVTQLK